MLGCCLAGIPPERAAKCFCQKYTDIVVVAAAAAAAAAPLLSPVITEDRCSQIPSRLHCRSTRTAGSWLKKGCFGYRRRWESQSLYLLYSAQSPTLIHVIWCVLFVLVFLGSYLVSDFHQAVELLIFLIFISPLIRTRFDQWMRFLISPAANFFSP